jgi:hypothetical protein
MSEWSMDERGILPRSSIVQFLNATMPMADQGFLPDRSSTIVQ